MKNLFNLKTRKEPFICPNCNKLHAVILFNEKNKVLECKCGMFYHIKFYPWSQITRSENSKMAKLQKRANGSSKTT
jgi:uncharacterized Zn finger protein